MIHTSFFVLLYKECDGSLLRAPQLRSAECREGPGSDLEVDRCRDAMRDFRPGLESSMGAEWLVNESQRFGIGVFQSYISRARRFAPYVGVSVVLIECDA
jgi:hypothetical protein